jgi:hypothetical protein
MAKSRKQRRQRKQHGGGWGYNGSVLDTMGASRLDVRSYTNDCNWPQRIAPQVGGGCGCGAALQRGGSCRGYDAVVGSNDLGKVPVYMPRAQMGGSPEAVNTYTAGYELGPATVLDSGSRFLDVSGYNKHGGTRRRQRRRQNRSRRQRK